MNAKDIATEVLKEKLKKKNVTPERLNSLAVALCKLVHEDPFTVLMFPGGDVESIFVLKIREKFNKNVNYFLYKVKNGEIKLGGGDA